MTDGGDLSPEQLCTLPGCSQPVADGRARGGLCEEHTPADADTCKDGLAGKSCRRQESPRCDPELIADIEEDGDSYINAAEESGEKEPLSEDYESNLAGEGPLSDAPETETGVFPEDVLDAEQWHAWKPTDDGRKVPRAPWLNPDWPDKFVSAQDPDVWTDFGTVREWTTKLPGYAPAVNVRDREEHPEESLLLIDFDDVRDPETGRVHPTVREHIQQVESYADVSTSGTGVHILCRGSLPDGVKAIDADLPASEAFPHAGIEVYDSGRFVAMTGEHFAETPRETADAQGVIDTLADEFATVPEGTPEAMLSEPEKSREQLASVETTDEIQDIFDAIQHTGPRDVRLRSPVTHERGDGSRDRDPTWRESKSGTGLAEVDGGWIERKGLHGLDALQVVALEERIITGPEEYPEGERFWRAVDALRERGAHIPEYEGPERGESEPVAVLPDLAPNARAAANGWDWYTADRESTALSIDAARERTNDTIADAYQSGDRVLIEALPTTGKTYGAVLAAAETGTPITILTPRGHKEQYHQLREWCEEHGLEAAVLPSFHQDCGSANGEHGEEIQATVEELYSRGATGKEIHRDAEYELGHPLPCDGPAGDRCGYKTKWELLGRKADEYDVLIGNPLHAHVGTATKSRTVVFDEFDGSTFQTALHDGYLAGAVTRFLKQHDGLPFENYADLMESRKDAERRADALTWFQDRGAERDAGQAFTSGGHVLSPVVTFTLLAGAENDLGNKWERATLPGDTEGIGVFDRETGRVHVLRPPDLRYASGVVALDGTPTRRLWELSLGTRLNHRQVLTDAERVEYLRDTLSLNLVRTTEWVKSYNSEDHVNPENDGALLDAITEEHGRSPAVLTTKTGERVHENAGLYETDGKGGLADGNGRVSDLAHYGNLLGSNRFANTRLGAVIGSNHYGDGFIQRWGAFAGEAVERGEGKGADLSYSGLGNDVLAHMREHDTLQAAMRFGRDGGGATVYVHTNTLPEWVPVAGEGRVIQTWSDGMRQVVEAATGLTEWTTRDLAEHPAVEIGESQIRRNLHALAERGAVSVETEGNGFVWRDDGLHRLGEHGEVELEPVDPDELTEEESARMARTTTYTWYAVTSAPDRSESGGSALRPSEPGGPAPVDGSEPPPRGGD